MGTGNQNLLASRFQLDLPINHFAQNFFRRKQQQQSVPCDWLPQLLPMTIRMIFYVSELQWGLGCLRFSWAFHSDVSKLDRTDISRSGRYSSSPLVLVPVTCGQRLRFLPFIDTLDLCRDLLALELLLQNTPVPS
jgi:hypothetical protein